MVNSMVLDRYKNYLLAKNATFNTIRNYQQKLNCLSSVGEFDKLTKVDIEMFVGGLDCSISSKNAYIRAIKSFYSFLIDAEMINNNPTERVKLLREVKKEVDVISEEDLNKIFKYEGRNQDKYRLAFNLQFASALRASEICNIRIEDIDFENRTIVVIGKGNKKRTAYFTLQVKEIMLDYIKKNNIKDYLFMGQKGNKWTQKNITEAFKSVCKTTGVDITKLTNVTHALRSTRATDLFEKGATIKEVQTVLGHSSPQTTLRHYSGVTESRLKSFF